MVGLGACAVIGAAGCTRANPGFGDDNSGTGSGTNDSSATDASVGDASVATMSSASTTKPTTTADDDATGAEATSATHDSGTLDTGEAGTHDTTDTDPAFDVGRGACGNGELDEGEGCDVARNPPSCGSLEYGAGFTECTAECKLLTHCCGDEILEEPEICEVNAVYDCPPYGNTAELAVECTADCTPADGCPACGDQVVQDDVEDCDFEGLSTCEEYGLQGGQGDLGCNACTFTSQTCCIPAGSPCSYGKDVGCCEGECNDGVCPENG